MLGTDTQVRRRISVSHRWPLYVFHGIHWAAAYQPSPQPPPKKILSDLRSRALGKRKRIIILTSISTQSLSDEMERVYGKRRGEPKSSPFRTKPVKRGAGPRGGELIGLKLIGWRGPDLLASFFFTRERERDWYKSRARSPKRNT